MSERSENLAYAVAYQVLSTVLLAPVFATGFDFDPLLLLFTIPLVFANVLMMLNVVVDCYFGQVKE